MGGTPCSHSVRPDGDGNGRRVVSSRGVNNGEASSVGVDLVVIRNLVGLRRCGGRGGVATARREQPSRDNRPPYFHHYAGLLPSAGCPQQRSRHERPSHVQVQS